MAEPFDDWLNNPARNRADVWYESNGVIIGTSTIFLQIFNGIIGHLKRLLEDDDFDGDIRNRFLISSSLMTRRNKVIPVVRLTVAATAGERRAKGTRNGILKDIRDVRSMVKSCVTLFPDRPSLWSLFDAAPIYSWPQAQGAITLKDVKKLALYNFSHPLFLDKRGSSDLIHKVYEIRERNRGQFGIDVQFTGLSDMSGWHTRTRQDHNLSANHRRQPPLWGVLYDRPKNKMPILQSRFLLPSGFPIYTRVVLIHARDIHSWILAGRVLRELRETFPDGLPKMHLALCKALVDDAHCVACYGEDICKLIRHGPHGYRGLKI